MTFTVRLKEQPAEPRSLLERNIRMWAVVVQKIMPRLSPKPPEEAAAQLVAIAFRGERTGEEWLADAHLLVTGIRQIEKHLQYLKTVGFRTPEIALAEKQFSAACKTADVKNLRNLLEYQAAYIVGKGKKPHLVVDLKLDLKQSVSFGSDAASWIEPPLDGTIALVWVSVFGRKFPVDRIVRAVAALEVALREGSQPPQEGGDSTGTVTVALPIRGGPTIPWTFPEENARAVLAWLLAHEENSDEYRTVVNLFREALHQGER
jgi:hypothetical protein